MTGERLGWYRLASRLHMSKQRCQVETTSREFNDWLVFMEMEKNFQTPEHFYLAQIAKEVASVLAKNPKSIQIKHFLLKFIREGEDPVQLSPEEAEERSKSFWGALIGQAQRVMGMRGKNPNGPNSP